MNQFPKLSLAVAVLVGALLPAASVCADQFDSARAAIRQQMLQQNVPAIAVAVWKDGRILWEEGFGWADVENRIAATEHTMFNLASLSKTMTATGLMTLVQAGKVDLETPANDYLGADRMTSYVGNPAAVTVRSLANHTSGLPGSDQWFYGADAPKLPAMSETIARYGILIAPAGERHVYSNLGYGILGQLVARVSGKRYEDFMRQDVFLPLGMTHSSMNVASGLEKYQAIRYDYDRKPLPAYLSAEPASASIYSSVHDLARFGLYFLKSPQRDQRGILSATSMDRMMQEAIDEEASPARAVKADEDGYAIGWIRGHEGGYVTYGHSGSSSGVNTNFLLVPSERLGVVILANADGGGGALHKALLKSVLPGWREPPAAAPRSPEAKFEPTPQITGTWQGKLHTFEGEQNFWLKVLPTGDVHVRIGGEPWLGNRSTVRQEALLNNVKFKDGRLTGTTLSQIETGDTKRYPHTVSLYLTLRGEELNGAATACSIFDGRWIYGLPHWVTLQKTPAN